MATCLDVTATVSGVEAMAYRICRGVEPGLRRLTRYAASAAGLRWTLLSIFLSLEPSPVFFVSATPRLAFDGGREKYCRTREMKRMTRKMP